MSRLTDEEWDALNSAYVVVQKARAVLARWPDGFKCNRRRRERVRILVRSFADYLDELHELRNP